jgi:hypothetical protein
LLVRTTLTMSRVEPTVLPRQNPKALPPLDCDAVGREAPASPLRSGAGRIVNCRKDAGLLS